MFMKLEQDEELIGRSHLIIKKGEYIKKFYPTVHNELFDTWWLNHVKDTTKLFKLVHPDLFVSEEEDENFYCVTQHFIENTNCTIYGYEHNVHSYLTNLINVLGYDYTKRDLQWYNLFYRKSDDKPFCIDWDAHEELRSEQEAYNYYKSELTGSKWQWRYNMSREDAESTFDKLWKKV